MWVISNTAISLDGRIHTQDERPPMLGSRRDLQRMRMLRAQVDAVLVGGATFRRWPIPTLPEDTALAQRDRPFWNIVVSRHLDIEPKATYIAEKRIKKLVLTTPMHKSPLFETEIEVYPGNNIDINWIIETLDRRGIQRLMIEAGGDLLSQFLRAGAVDEVYVTLCPVLIGGKGSASLVDGQGFRAADMPRMTLKQVEQVEDELYLHYLVQKSSVRSPAAGEGSALR